jgi:hypothetical protein
VQLKRTSSGRQKHEYIAELHNKSTKWKAPTSFVDAELLRKIVIAKINGARDVAPGVFTEAHMKSHVTSHSGETAALFRCGRRNSAGKLCRGGARRLVYLDLGATTNARELVMDCMGCLELHDVFHDAKYQCGNYLFSLN